MNIKRGIGWTFMGIGVLLIAIIAGVFFLMRSKGFHKYVLAKIEQVASDSTGGRVTVQSYDFHWSNLSADLFGVVIHGREKAGTQPLLEVDRLFVDVRIVSLLRKEVDVNEIVVDHPVVHYISFPDGTSNIPQPQNPGKKSNTNVFDLGIKHVLLDRGEVYYQQRKQDLDADLHDLLVEVKYNLAESRYDGKLSYDQGTLRMGGTSPLPHALRASFTADRNNATLESAEMDVGTSRLWLNAVLRDYSHPRVSGNYRVLMYPQDFREFLKNPDLPSGQIVLTGNMDYDSSNSRPFMLAVAAQGRVESPELLVSTPQARSTVRPLDGRFQLRDGKLTAVMYAGVLGGKVAATAEVSHLDTTASSLLRVTMSGISLADARSALRSSNTSKIPVTGRVDAYAEASWTGPISTLRAHADATLKAAVSEKRGTGDNIVPVNGVVHASYEGRTNVLSLANTLLRTPQSSITLDGQVSKHSNLKIVARTSDVRELNALASSIPSTSNDHATSKNTVEISGPMILNASVTGDMQHPNIAGTLAAHDLTVQSDKWKSVQAAFQANPSEVVISQASLVGVGQGQAKFSGRVGLQNWKYSESAPLSATISVTQMPISALQHMAGMSYPVSGMLSLNANVQGTQLNPAGKGRLEVTNGRVQDQPLDVAIHFTAANQTINSDLQLRTPAGSLQGAAAFRPRTKAYEVHLHAPGVVLAKLNAIQARDLPLNGTLTFSADGAGTLDDPQLQASLEIPKLQVKDASVQSVRSNLTVAHHQAEFNLNSDLANSYVEAKGTVGLTGDYPANLSFDTRAIPIESLIALYKPLPNRDFHGQIEMHATARGPLKDKSRMEAHVSIPTLRASYQEIQIGNVQPIKADYQNQVLRLQPSQIKGTDTNLSFQGELPLGASDRPATLTLQGNVDLHIAKLFQPDLISGGTVILDVRANRTGGNVGVGGQIKLKQVRFATVSSPMGVQNLNGVIDVHDNQIEISSLQGQTGGGTISAGGTITYRPQLAMNVSLQANSVRLRYPDGIRSVVDCSLAVSGDSTQGTVTGRVLINTLGFTNDFDLSTFMGQFGGNTTSPAPSSPFLQNLKLNIALQSTSELQLTSSQVSVEGQINLRISGTAAEPVVLGRTTLNNGDIFFMNNRYHLERAILNFTDPTQTNPDVNILLTTTIQQYNLSVTLLGPVSRLRTTYVSDPPLPPVDVINLIARGQTTEQGTPTNFDANSVIASQLAGQVSSRLQKFAGISSLQIDPTIGGSNTNPGARIAIQQQVTRNFIFTFSSDVTNPQEDIVQGEYRLTPKWSVSAQRDQYGGYAFDARYHSSF